MPRNNRTSIEPSRGREASFARPPEQDISVKLMAVAVIFVIIIIVASQSGSSSSTSNYISSNDAPSDHQLCQIDAQPNSVTEKALDRYYEGASSTLSKIDKFARNLILQFNNPIGSKPTGSCHKRFGARGFLKGFRGTSTSIRKFVNDDLLPYLSCFETVNEEKRNKEKCVSYISKGTSREQFLQIVNPTQEFNQNGCYCRMIVVEELADFSHEDNHVYKHLFERGFDPSFDHEAQNRLSNDRVLILAFTKYSKSEDLEKVLHKRSWQMFDVKVDVSDVPKLQD